MAITTFGELKSELSGYQFNTRLLTSYENATIDFERSANRRLRVLDMETSTNLTTSSGSVALPSDYLAWRTVLWKGRTPYVELDYVHPAYLHSTWIEVDNGDPKIFTIEGSTFYAEPDDDTASIFEFHYYQKLTTITSSDSAYNWLLTKHPDCYVWGVLTELFAKSRNREAAELYKARRDEVFQEITQLSAQTTGATSRLVRTADYF